MGQKEQGTSDVPLSRAAPSNKEVGAMFLRATFVAGAIVMAAIGSQPAADAAPPCYISKTTGDCVPDPEQAPAPPPGWHAQCRDGTYSFSEHRSGTCSGHHGVQQWNPDWTP